MLILSRRKGESIKIDGGITVTVLKVGAVEVKLGIEAPDETGIVRDDAVKREANDD